MNSPLPDQSWGRFPASAAIKLIELLTARVVLLEAGSAAGGGGVFAGTGNPNGVLSVTGPAIYFDRTDPLAPIMYSKCTAGASSTQWI